MGRGAVRRREGATRVLASLQILKTRGRARGRVSSSSPSMTVATALEEGGGFPPARRRPRARVTEVENDRLQPKACSGVGGRAFGEAVSPASSARPMFVLQRGD